MKQKLNILIVDDEQSLRDSLKTIIHIEFSDEFDLTIQEVTDGQEAIGEIKKKPFDLVMMDVKMPKMDGLKALQLIKSYDPKIFVVIMTAHSNIKDAILAIKEGAYDYLSKPIQPNKLKNIILKALEANRLVSSLIISNPIFDEDVDSEFIGDSLKMKKVYDLIYKLCKVDTTVLIRGENGTGKELVARAIHYNSPNKSGKFVAINCGAIPENLVESELFGHEKGAFTGAHERKIGKFQIANNGTLFLDEIAELRPEIQVKLLRVLQEKTFVPVGSNRELKTNARIVTATNQNLEKMIEEKKFREDLFYRLNVMPIFLPPLRERKEDIPTLVDHFIKVFNKTHENKILSANQESLDLMKNYNWPGNIRELENVIERAFIIENSNILTSQSLPGGLIENSKQEIDVNMPLNYHGKMDFEFFKLETEKEFIIEALKANKGKINKTVASANIPKNTLLRKIKKYNINVKDYY